MKNNFGKLLLLLALFPATVMAGGLVTNTNQSASFIRNPVQDAVIDATGTYYNPAGLAFLKDGFHFSLSNQTITQTRTINSTYPGLARTEFEGGVFAPLFPTFYGVYKTGDLALSFGVNPIGGGGSANFENGLPSFDESFASFTNQIAGFGINSSYSLDAAFDGSSLNWGFQANGSYAINHVLSFSLGLRYIIANNSYNGHLRNVMINPNHPLNPNGSGNMVGAPAFFNTLSGAASGAATSLQPIIDGGIGGLTLNQLLTLELITPEAAAQIRGGLPNYAETMTAAQIQAAYSGLATQMAGVAALTDAEFRDREVEATQSGYGIAPIFGVNIKFSDELNFAVKYEHQATITLTNSTTRDDVGMFPDGDEVRADMPSMLSLGLSYKALSDLRLSAGFHYYFDKNADYGKSRPNAEIMDRNFWEAGLGVEYLLNRNLLVSAGYLRTQTGVNDLYHSDLSHSLSTNSIGAGFKYMINPNMGINLGVMNTMYDEHTKTFDATPSYDETYSRKALTFAIGLDFKL